MLALFASTQLITSLRDVERWSHIEPLISPREGVEVSDLALRCTWRQRRVVGKRSRSDRARLERRKAAQRREDTQIGLRQRYEIRSAKRRTKDESWLGSVRDDARFRVSPGEHAILYILRVRPGVLQDRIVRNRATSSSD